MSITPRAKRIIIISLAILALIAALALLYRDELTQLFFAPTESDITEGISAPSESDAEDEERPDIEIVARDLTVPWEVVVLPGGDLLVTERSGTLQRISEDERVYPISGVAHVGEGGLLGLALHPDFAENRYIYLYLTTETGNGLTNRVERYRLDSDTLSNRTVIISDIPGAQYHDGGRIAFGPDGHLYITTGDASNPQLAQNRDSLAGKILRVTANGGIPDDNPFGTAVYSYGHRNPQGLTWDNEGQLWATEHGRSGAQSGMDEVNRIEPGRNYGWPTIEGDARASGMQRPVIHSGASDTWAPAGMAYYDGSLFFAGLRGQSLYEAKIQDDGSLELVAHFRSDYGRLRAVTLGPDDYLYLTTSNTDGRGGVNEGDDKVIRVNPEIFR